MYARMLATIGVAALALSLAGIVSADTGNVATDSVGSVQASALSAAPVVAAVTPDGTVASTVPATIAGDGNDASDSTGTAQLGGGNSATDSTGSGQLGTASATPSATATPVGNAASANGSATAGNASNTATKKVAAVQLGQPSVSATTTTDRPRTASKSLVLPKVTAPAAGKVALGNASVSASPQVTHSVSADPRSATVRPAVNVSPNTSAGLGKSAQTQSGGSVGLAQNKGDTADHSFGTVQGGALTASPALAFTSPSRELALMLGGSSGVAGGSPNSASDSAGTVQIGSGNEADPSIGTLQIGSLQLGPTAAFSSPNGTTGLDGSSGIAGGNNQANNSDGTVQIGGNSANGSTGTLQVAPLSENEQGTFGNTPAGSGTLAAPEQIGSGSGNSATNSHGTVQVGGGNSATGSTGVLQFGGRSPSTGSVVSSTPTGSTPTTSAPGAGSTPAASGTGAATAAATPGSSTTAASASAAAGPSSSRTPLANAATKSAAATAATAASSASPSRSGTATTSTAGTSAAAGSPSPGNGTSILGQTLPFTGFALVLATMLGFGLLGAGVTVRRLAATR